MTRIVFGFLFVCVGCAAPASEPVGSSSATLGEIRDGFPSWEERVVWVYTNRARAEPSAELADCAECADRDCYEPAPPLTWGHELGRAARFHSEQLDHLGGVLMHSSPCRLATDVAERYTPGTCNGAPECACEGGVFECVYPSCSCTENPSMCTRFDQRVSMFGGAANAENIAGTSSPLLAVHMWVTEPYDIADCAHSGPDSRGRTKGHRVNMLTRGPAIGVGASSRYLTQDFGWGDAPAKVVAGVHYPEDGSALEMRASWYDGAGPSRGWVNVDGACTEMALERGTVENGTYLANVTTGAGCRQYYFHFQDGAGTDHFFPTTGSFGIGCAEPWSEARPTPCDCSGGACVEADAGTTAPPPDAGAHVDAGVGGMHDAGGDGHPEAGTSTPGPRPGDAMLVEGGCNASRGASNGLALVTLLGICVALRRRRRFAP